MRRDAHPARPRPELLTAPASAAALGLLALALTLASGALRSPFLLLLPFALLLLLRVLPRRESRWVLGFVLLALVAGSAAAGTLGWVEAAGAIAGLLALHVTVDALRVRAPAAAAAAAEVRPGGGTAELRPDQQLDELAERTRAWTNAVALTVWQCTAGRAHAVAAAGRARPSAQRLDGDPLGWVAREGTPLWIDPAPAWSEPQMSVAAARLQLGAAGAWLATLEFAPAQGRPQHADIDAACGALRLFVGVLAGHLAAEEDRERLHRLLALLRRIPVRVEAQEFASELLDAAVALTGATGGSFGTWSGEAGEILATAGVDGGPVVGSRFSAPGSELALAVRAGARIDRQAPAWRLDRTQVASGEDRWRARPRALSCVPLATPSGTVGVIGLWAGTPDGLDGAALSLLEAALPYAALQLDHAREFGQLRERAERDALTGLRNRRAFDGAFLAERLRFDRYGRPLAALMIDVDHFKAINDTHGHEAGDQVLRAVAGTIARAVRDVDIVARFGGEEFVVLLPETSAAAATEVAERVRSAVEGGVIEFEGKRIPVQVSVGIAALPELVATADALLPGADAALYSAKRAGRNRVVTAQAAGERPRLV